MFFHKTIIFYLRCTVLALIGIATIQTTWARNRIVEISNPYANVVWFTYETHIGNFHTHTRQSDGRHSVPGVIDAYHEIGYTVLAITDHNTRRYPAAERITHPWEDFDRDSNALGMIAVPGSELSIGDHIVSLFSEYNSQTRDVGARLAGIGQAGGIGYFAHPMRYSRSPEFYAEHYEQNPHIFGQAIYNQGDRHSGHRELWDAVLSLSMPERPVWGIAEDDTHRQEHVGRNRVYMLMPALSHDNVRASLMSGAFYSTYSTSANHTPPALTGVRVDEARGTITLTADNHTHVRWMSMGEEVATGETIDLVRTPGIDRYVRAEFQGEEGRMYTNPFGLTYFINRPPTVSAGPDRTVQVGEEITLEGSVSDDGLPNPPGTVTVRWQLLSGVGRVSVPGTDSPVTKATFLDPGTYVLGLAAFDGQLQASDQVTITVTP